MLITHRPLPHQVQAFHINELETLHYWFHENAEKLEEVEEHMKTCSDCIQDARAWETRALLLERHATLAERIEELNTALNLPIN